MKAKKYYETCLIISLQCNAKNYFERKREKNIERTECKKKRGRDQNKLITLDLVIERRKWYQINDNKLLSKIFLCN